MSEVFAVQHKTRRRFSRGGFNLVLAALLQRLTERVCWWWWWSLLCLFFFFSYFLRLKDETRLRRELVTRSLSSTIWPICLPLLQYIFFIVLYFFLFLLLCWPLWPPCGIFFYYFIFVVAASRCWATASLHLEEESPAAIYCVCHRDWRFCYCLPALFCGLGIVSYVSTGIFIGS